MVGSLVAAAVLKRAGVPPIPPTLNLPLSDDLAAECWIQSWEGRLHWEPLASPLAKALPTAPGQRWITVHPHGPGSHGQPVLLHPGAEHGVFHVVAGAGGKLNGLRIQHPGKPKTAEELEATRKEREKVRREELARRREKEVAEVGEEEAQRRRRGRAEAIAEVRLQRREEEQRLVGRLGELLGWQETGIDEVRLAESGLSEGAQNLLRGEHHRRQLSRAKQAMEAGARALVEDQEARAAALGEIPLTPGDSDQLSFTDVIDDKDPSGGLGYAPHRREEATEEEIAATEAAAREARERELTPEQREKRAKHREAFIGMTQQIREEARAARERLLPAMGEAVPGPLDPWKAAELVRLRLELRKIQRVAGETTREIRDAARAPESYEIDIGQHVDPVSREEVERDIQQELAAKELVSLLGEIDERTLERSYLTDPDRPLYRDDYHGHIAAGAYAAASELTLSAVRQSLVDRDIADVLGPSATAQLIARRLRETLGDDDARKIGEGLGEYHRDTQTPRIQQAMASAKGAFERAGELAAHPVEDSMDLLAAIELNRQRKAEIGRARETLGAALGRVEATSALYAALTGPLSEKVRVPLGIRSTESAVKQMAGLGLHAGEYELISDGKNRFAVLDADAMRKLAHPVDALDIERARDLSAVMRGEKDEAGWLPAGFSRREMTTFDEPDAGVERLRRPLTLGQKMAPEDVEKEISRYVGLRLADGHAPQQILDDLFAADFRQARVPENLEDAYLKAVYRLFPQEDLDTPAHQARFDALAAEAARGLGYGEESALHSQGIPLGEATYEALHRALAKDPAGVVAFKPLGQLTPAEKAVLRDEFWAHHSGLTPEERQAQKERVRAAPKDEVPVEQGLLFDTGGEAAEAGAYGQVMVRDESKLAPEELDKWELYVRVHGGTARAYAALQDHIRGRLLQSYAQEHGRVYGQELRTGYERIRNWDRHLVGTKPTDEVVGRLQEETASKRRTNAELRRGEKGRFTSRRIREIAEEIRAREGRGAQQTTLFASEDDTPAINPEIERATIGRRAERQLASIMPYVARGFDPDRPVEVPRALRMDGRYIGQQRAIKAIETRKRLILAYGTGSGKSPIMIGAHTHLAEQGKVKRGLYLVPSAVQGQMAGEWLKFTQPGKYRWHASPGASETERMTAYRDDSGNHAVVMTHAAFREDARKLVARSLDVTPEEAEKRLRGMSPQGRSATIRQAFADHGANFDFLAIDEGHDALNRRGKRESALTVMVDGYARDMPYYVSATADPVKNDPSEAIDHLRKVAPERFEGKEAEFLRRYGTRTAASAEALQRLWAQHAITERITSGRETAHRVERVKLSAAQNAEIERVRKLEEKIRRGRREGRLELEALKQLAPEHFADAPLAHHEAIGRHLANHVGVARNAAISRAVHAFPDVAQNAKVQRIRQLASERKGKPGVIFAHHRETVKQIRDALQADGHRVVAITGADSAHDAEIKRLKFHPPDPSQATADVIVLSDRGATGMNLQRGSWLIQADTPDTAKGHNQRNGRIDRIGQMNDTELIDVRSDNPLEQKAEDRLATKYGLSSILGSATAELDDSGLARYLVAARGERYDDRHPLRIPTVDEQQDMFAAVGG